MSSSNPIIFLFNGGWFPASVWSGVQSALAAKGYKAIIPELSVNATDGSGAGQSAQDVVRTCHELVEPLMDAGHTFIVAGWSFGSVPAILSTIGWSVSERKQAGKKGGFLAIVNIAGLLVLQPGVDFLAAWAGGKGYLRYVDYDGVYVPNGILRLNEFAKDDFLNDHDEQAKEAWWEEMKNWKFSQAALETPITITLQDLTIPSTYVVLQNDLAFPTEAQEAIAGSHAVTKVVRINSGHCVFLGHEASIVELFDQHHFSSQKSDIIGVFNIARIIVTQLRTTFPILKELQYTSHVAAKYAIVGLTKRVWLDSAQNGLPINVIFPGYTDTPMTTGADVQKAIEATARVFVAMSQLRLRLGLRQEIADVCYFLPGAEFIC